MLNCLKRTFIFVGLFLIYFSFSIWYFLLYICIYYFLKRNEKLLDIEKVSNIIKYRFVIK